MYLGFGMAISGAYGIISSGRLMLTECFGESLPHIVTPANTAAFVALMSIGNLGGRLFWANGSDTVARRMGGDPFWGRKATFSCDFSQLPLFSQWFFSDFPLNIEKLQGHVGARAGGVSRDRVRDISERCEPVCVIPWDVSTHAIDHCNVICREMVDKRLLWFQVHWECRVHHELVWRLGGAAAADLR